MHPGKRLFAVPPAEFTKERDALARELRSQGKDEDARLVTAMRKPAAALWIANQLSRLAPDDVKALIHATARLQKGDDLREAMHSQREALTKLMDAAGRAALEAGTKLDLALQRRVQNTVQAAATTEPERLREGLIESELQPIGFEGLAGVPLPKPVPKQEPEKEKEKEKENQKELKKAEQLARRLAVKAEKLERAATKAQEAAARARGGFVGFAARALELRKG